MLRLIRHLSSWSTIGRWWFGSRHVRTEPVRRSPTWSPERARTTTACRCSWPTRSLRRHGIGSPTLVGRGSIGAAACTCLPRACASMSMSPPIHVSRLRRPIGPRSLVPGDWPSPIGCAATGVRRSHRTAMRQRWATPLRRSRRPTVVSLKPGWSATTASACSPSCSGSSRRRGTPTGSGSQPCPLRRLPRATLPHEGGAEPAQRPRLPMARPSSAPVTVRSSSTFLVRPS